MHPALHAAQRCQLAPLPGVRDAWHCHSVLHQTSFCLSPHGASAVSHTGMATLSLAACLAKGGAAPQPRLISKVTHMGLMTSLPKAISFLAALPQYWPRCTPCFHFNRSKMKTAQHPGDYCWNRTQKCKGGKALKHHHWEAEGTEAELQRHSAARSRYTCTLNIHSCYI